MRPTFESPFMVRTGCSQQQHPRRNGRTQEEVSRHDLVLELVDDVACSLLWLAWPMRGSSEVAGIIDDRRSSISWVDVVIVVWAGACASCSCVRFLCAFSLVLTSCGRLWPAPYTLLYIPTHTISTGFQGMAIYTTCSMYVLFAVEHTVYSAALYIPYRFYSRKWRRNCGAQLRKAFAGLCHIIPTII